jgi:hypothetical protein
VAKLRHFVGDADLAEDRQLGEHARPLPLAVTQDADHCDLGVMGWTPPAFLPPSGWTKEESMSLDLLAIDLGKQSFHVYGIDSDGVIVSRKLSRAKPMRAIAELAPDVLAMEALPARIIGAASSSPRAIGSG